MGVASCMILNVIVAVVTFAFALVLFLWIGKRKIRRMVDEQVQQEVEKQLKQDSSKTEPTESMKRVAGLWSEGAFETKNSDQEKEKITADDTEESNRIYTKLLDELSNSPDGDPSKVNPGDRARIKEFTDALNKIKSQKEFTQKDWYLKGQEEYGKDNYVRAIECFTECLNLNPELTDAYYAYYYRGLSKFSLGLYRESIRDFDFAETLDKPAYLYFIRATAYELLKDLPAALKDVQKAIALDAEYSAAIELRKEILEKMGK